MTVQRRNHILAACTLLVTIYLLASEVYPRFVITVNEYSGAKLREKSLMTRDEFLLRKKKLQSEKQRLDKMRKEKYVGEGREEGALFSYLNSLAKKSGIVVASFSPARSGKPAKQDERAFSIAFSAPFHKTARYINEIETGVFPVRISNLEMISDPPGNARLKISIVASTRLLAETR